LDIVIPYRHDVHGELELIYALKSIKKYLTGFMDIWVIGVLPSLKVKHLPCSDIDAQKEYSIANKILTACKCDAISDPFIVWHDDHFLLRPMDVSEFKYWHNGDLESTLKRSKGGYYVSVKNTIEMGFKKNFDIHTPFVVEKKRFSDNVIKPWTKECLVKTLYAKGEEGEYMEDCKINLPYTKARLREKLNGRLFFSTGPQGLQPEMMELFKELYDTTNDVRIS